MANVKISGLPAATSVIPGTDVAPLVSGGVTTKATPQQIVDAGLASPGAIGGTTPNTGKFTTVQSTVATGTAPFTVASTTNVANLNASSLNGATFASPGAIGSSTASTGAFTALSASSTVSGTGFSNYLASPPAIGSSVPAAGSFTTLNTTGNVGVGGNPGTNKFAIFNGATQAITFDNTNFLIGVTNSSGDVANTSATVSGKFYSLSSATYISTGASTLFVIPANSSWLVTIQTNNASGATTTAIVTFASGGNPVKVNQIAADNANFYITFSGTTIQVYNNLGGVIGFGFTAVRIY